MLKKFLRGLSARTRPVLDYFARMSAREKVLAGLTFGVLFLLLNVWLLDSLWRARQDLSAQLHLKQASWQGARLILAQADGWKQRDEWLQAHQPRLTVGTDRASGELFSQLQQLARQNAVNLENPQFLAGGNGAPASEGGGAAAGGRSYHQSVAVSCVARANWPSLVHFLAAVQQNPESFQVPEVVTLRSETGNPSQLRAELRISRWYAPAPAPASGPGKA